MKLLIVESPAKCSKIQSFLGAGWEVIASMGHIRGLEESLDALNIEKGWIPKYVDLLTKKDAIAKLKAKASKADEILLGQDCDREGEGIAWHVATILKLPIATTKRITFNEITKPAILYAVENPRTIDMNMVYSQQARSMLDMLIGFTISKVLWTHVPSAKSAGRCQTPALTLVVERDAEIDSHSATSSYKINGTFKVNSDLLLEAKGSIPMATEEDAKTLLKTFSDATTKPNATIVTIVEKVSTSNPPKPLITSSLQQEASSLHGYNPKSTMQCAQKLYEAGLITYMRTDNALLSQEACYSIRKQIEEDYGKEYVGFFGQYMIKDTSSTASAGAASKPTKGKKKETDAKVQGAHEAIRPTHIEESEPKGTWDAMCTNVYKLIWRKAMQCQMSASTSDIRTVKISIDGKPDYMFEHEQSKIKFAGYKILDNTSEEKTESDLLLWNNTKTHATTGKKIVWTRLSADEVFTKPPPRYTEASLIHELEKKGIGRPSTFASLITTLFDRLYVEKTKSEGKTMDCKHMLIDSPTVWPPKVKVEKQKVSADKNKIQATELGKLVSNYLQKNYSDLFSYDYTSKMESELDIISEGKMDYKTLLQSTYDCYKERYITDTSKSAEAKASVKASLERELSDSIKVVQTRKGILIVHSEPIVKDSKITDVIEHVGGFEEIEEKPKKKGRKAKMKEEMKTTFAKLPEGTTFDSLTLEEAEEALEDAKTAKEGIVLGDYKGTNVLQKTGPYGKYALYERAAGGAGTTVPEPIRVPIKPTDSFEQICLKIETKLSGESDARKVGSFTIKRGPYGLYCFKNDLKKPRFVKWPVDKDHKTATESEIEEIYKAGCAKPVGKPRFFKKKKE